MLINIVAATIMAALDSQGPTGFGLVLLTLLAAAAALDRDFLPTMLANPRLGESTQRRTRDVLDALEAVDARTSGAE